MDRTSPAATTKNRAKTLPRALSIRLSALLRAMDHVHHEALENEDRQGAHAIDGAREEIETLLFSRGGLRPPMKLLRRRRK